jgi:hypothetical protein
MLLRWHQQLLSVWYSINALFASSRKKPSYKLQKAITQLFISQL